MNARHQPRSQGLLGVLRDAETSRFTGSLDIDGGTLAGTLYLDEGRIYWASVPGDPDIAEIVARLPVNSIMLARIRWHMANGLDLAQALDKLDDIDHTAVQVAMREAADSSFRRLLDVEAGQFHMVPGAVAPVGVVVTWSLPSPPARERQASPAPMPAGPVWLLEQAGGPVELDEVEWRIVAALAAPQTADVLATRSGQPMADVLAAVERLRQPRLAVAPLAEARPAPTLRSLRPAETRATPPARPPEPRPAPPARPIETRPAPRPNPLAPADGPVGGDRRSNALRRLISAVRKI